MFNTKWIIGLVLIILLVIIGLYMVTNKSSADIILRTTIAPKGTVVRTTTTGVETIKYSEKIPLSGSDWVSFRVITTTTPTPPTTIPKNTTVSTPRTTNPTTIPR